MGVRAAVEDERGAGDDDCKLIFHVCDRQGDVSSEPHLFRERQETPDKQTQGTQE